MPIINYCHRGRSDITAFNKINTESFIFSTIHHGIKIVSSKDCSALVNFKDDNLNFNTSAICFSSDGQLVAFSTLTHLYIADIINKKIIKSIYLDGMKLLILSFDASSKYIVAGNIDGRTLLYRYDSSSLLARLCSFPHQRAKTKIKNNFESAIVFYKNLFAISGYGGAIFIIDIYSQANKAVLSHGTSRKNALLFLNNEMIVSGDNEGVLRFISIQNNKLIKSINLPFEKTKQIIQIPNTKYLAIHNGEDNIFIVDSKEYKIIHSNYLNFEDKIIAVEALDDKTLIVCLKNKNIFHVELPSRERLNSLILHNSLDEAFELIEKEPMLQDTLEHISLERMYKKTYADSVNALINQNITLAKQIIDMYKDVNSKKESIKLLFKSFESYARFKTLYFEKKYALAYAMCSKFPALKMTKQYESMEFRWKEAFTNARRHILRGKLDLAKALFAQYITISSKRPIIELILKHNDLFIDFLKALENQDFKTVNMIALKNPLFLQMPIYKTLEYTIEKSINRIESYIKKNKIELAQKYLSKIETSIAENPITILIGARQVGKTSLMES